MNKDMVSNFLIAVCIGFVLWIVVSIVDVQIHNGNPNHEYSEANAIVLLTELGEMCSPKVETKCCLVTDCVYRNGNGLWEVVCCDTDGNEWAYWSDNPIKVSDIVQIYICRGEIIDAK